MNLTDPTLVDQLVNKLCVNAMLLANPEELDAYTSETLLDFVYGKRQLEALENKYGATYIRVQQQAKRTFRALARTMAATDGGPAGIEAIAKDLATGLASELPALPAETCENLARHYVADWFINCPLRFRATA